MSGPSSEAGMAHLLDRQFLERAETAIMLGLLWAGLGACVIGATIYDVAFWISD